MVNNTKIHSLAQEAKELILEFREVESVMAANMTESIDISEDGSILHVVDSYDGPKDYKITEVSSVLSMEMQGYGMMLAGFYEALEIELSELDEKYTELEADDFIQYAGRLYYMKYRCEEIFERLEKIEKEAAAELKG